MNIRQAILKAADSIETREGPYNFWADGVGECGTPMCMFGWIGYHMGMIGAGNLEIAEAIGLRSTGWLYAFSRERGFDHHSSVGDAAKALRAFADHRFPAESRALIPTSVMAIFSMTPEQIRAEFQRENA